MKWWKDLTVNPNQLTITKSIYKWMIDTDVEWLKMKMLNSNIDSFQVRICETMRVVFYGFSCIVFAGWNDDGSLVCVCVRVVLHFWDPSLQNWMRALEVECAYVCSIQDAFSSQHECKKSLTVFNKIHWQSTSINAVGFSATCQPVFVAMRNR